MSVDKRIEIANQEKQHEYNSLLLTAMENVNFDKTMDLIRKGASVDIKDNSDETPLHFAAKNGCLEIAELLISNKADVNARDDFDETPLYFASANGYVKVAQLLVDHGADVNARNTYDETPLHFAAKNGYLEVAECLIDNGADIAVRDNNGKTPLHFAAKNGYLEIAECLIDNGADIAVRDNNGKTPLHFAAKNGYLEIAKLFIDNGANADMTDNYGNTPFHFAAGNGHLEIVKLFIDNGADVNIKDENGKTPLDVANINHQLEVASFLRNKPDEYNRTLLSTIENGNLARGKDPFNIRNNYRRTPLHHAAYTGKGIDHLINGGADIEAEDDTGWRPLHFAAWSGNLQAVKSLIDNDADIEARDNNGKTPLHLAAGNNHLEIVRLFINKRANFEAKDKNGKTPLYYAILAASSETALFLLENGASIETKDNYNMTLLHSAAKGGNLQAVKFLMDNGVNIEAKDNYNNTPLHYAAREDHLDIVKYLIGEGADVNVKNSNGDTPLDIATKLSSHLGIIKYFKSNSTLRSRRSIEFKELPKENALISDNSLKNNKIDYNRDQVASGASKPSRWINDCISWAKKLAASTFSIIPSLPSQYNIADKNNVKSDNKNIPQSISSVGWNKFLNNENIALASCVADALDNTPSRRYQGLMSKGVEVVPSSRVAVEFALKKFNSFVEDKIRNLESKEQARIHVELKDAYPEIIASLERGVEFSGNVGLDNVLEKCKKCFCTNVLPKDKISTCLSDVGVTKLGNNLSMYL